MADGDTEDSVTDGTGQTEVLAHELLHWLWLGSPSTCLSLDGSAPSGGSGSYQGHARDPDDPTVISGFLSSH